MLPYKCTIHASFKLYDLFFLFLQAGNKKNEFNNNYTKNLKTLRHSKNNIFYLVRFRFAIDFLLKMNVPYMKFKEEKLHVYNYSLHNNVENILNKKLKEIEDIIYICI